MVYFKTVSRGPALVITELAAITTGHPILHCQQEIGLSSLQAASLACRTVLSVLSVLSVVSVTSVLLLLAVLLAPH